jgi:hypothetical protein
MDRKTSPSLPVAFNPIDLLFESPRPKTTEEEDAEQKVQEPSEETLSAKRAEEAAFVSEPFGAYLKQLNPEDFHSITLATNRYKKMFTGKTEKQRVEAFNKFRIFVAGYGNTMTPLLLARLHACTRGEASSKEMEALRLERQAMDAYFLLLHKKVLDKYGLHLSQDEESENLFAGVRPEFYVRILGDTLPAYIRDFLPLQDREYVRENMFDGYLNISMEECGKRARNWEKYLQQHPNSAYKEDATRYFNENWDLFTGGHHDDDMWDGKGILLPEVKKAYQTYLENNAGSQSAKQLKKLYSILQAHKFEWSEELAEEYEKVLGRKPCFPGQSIG